TQSNQSPLENYSGSIEKRPGSCQLQHTIIPVRNMYCTVCMDVKEYFLERWPFPNGRARLNFAAKEFPTRYCRHSSSSPDRTTRAFRCLMMFFLVKDLLAHMTQEEGSAYIERLCSIIACEIAPTDGQSVEEAVYDIWKPMVAIDGILANQMIEPIKDLWHLHIDDRSLETKGMVGWLEFRDRACASKLLSALQRFIGGYHI
ncbi:aristolochene synthase, partial [Colletotrichum kahawae]